jgi:hypothetical protein
MDEMDIERDYGSKALVIVRGTVSDTVAENEGMTDYE